MAHDEGEACMYVKQSVLRELEQERRRLKWQLSRALQTSDTHAAELEASKAKVKDLLTIVELNKGVADQAVQRSHGRDVQRRAELESLHQQNKQQHQRYVDFAVCLMSRRISAQEWAGVLRTAHTAMEEERKLRADVQSSAACELHTAYTSALPASDAEALHVVEERSKSLKAYPEVDSNVGRSSNSLHQGYVLEIIQWDAASQTTAETPTPRIDFQTAKTLVDERLARSTVASKQFSPTTDVPARIARAVLTDLLLAERQLQRSKQRSAWRLVDATVRNARRRMLRSAFDRLASVRSNRRLMHIANARAFVDRMTTTLLRWGFQRWKQQDLALAIQEAEAAQQELLRALHHVTSYRQTLDPYSFARTSEK
ncbi:hypothetical protein JG687_00012889 [Phytophthora cactorum]|uniref:Uncharacterized protein n=1 Tax=Phytophthora cactorum TaxID=29920 RepID=A0A8T1U384_9STRA|nr:hypothetical protein JG687_00012889 [Phytophthora cactorum]